MSTYALSDIVETFDNLEIEEKELAFELIEKNYVESKREQLVMRVKQAESNYLSAQVKSGTVSDLLMDLNDA